MPIFLSIASYRDPELMHTIKSAINMAQQPDKIHFGIVYQGDSTDRPDFSILPRYSLISMPISEARGVGFARSKAMELYNGEEYYMQVDSHTQFVQDWDRKSIAQLDRAKKLTDGDPILSYYPVPYHRDGSQLWIQTVHNENFKAHPMKQVPKLKKTLEWTAERVNFSDPERKNPELSTTILGGFVFASGKIVEDVPYDPEISFFGEELCFTARAWTRGWDIFSPTENLAYHYYGRNGFPKIWKDDMSRKISWKEIQDQSVDKQKRVLCGIEQGVYGLGNTRSIEQYEQLVGINFKEFYGLENK